MASLGGAVGRPRPVPRPVGYDELSSLVGSTFESEPFTIEREESARFEALTYFIELAPHETSAEVSTQIVEGFHALALLDPLFNEHLRFDRETCYVLNYGIDSLRFPSQLTNAQPLTCRLAVTAVEPRRQGVTVVIAFEIAHTGSAKPGAVGVWRLFVALRTPDSHQSQETP